MMAELPRPIMYLPQLQGWNTGRGMVLILRAIGRAVRQNCPGRGVIVVFGSAPCHLTAPVLDEFRASRMMALLVPPGLTSVLQPLDTHVFGPFKRRLAELQTQLRQVEP